MSTNDETSERWQRAKAWLTDRVGAGVFTLPDVLRLADYETFLLTTMPTPEVAWPDIGPDPMKGDRADRLDQSIATVREAYVRQQEGVPDQTALVWRWHISALLEVATRMRARAACTTEPMKGDGL